MSKADLGVQRRLSRPHDLYHVHKRLNARLQSSEEFSSLHKATPPIGKLESAEHFRYIKQKL